MNTIEELLKQDGINEYTAKSMIDCYKARIGQRSGVYEISDITYNVEDGSKGITLKCTLCGNEIVKTEHKKIKWNKLNKRCKCQKELKEKLLEEERKKNFQNKKSRFESVIGKDFGDYKIVSLEYINNKFVYTAKCNECGYKTKMSAESFDKRKDFHCTRHYEAIKYDEKYIGRKKNFLTVTGITRSEKDNRRLFVCKCDCGNTTKIEPNHWEFGVVKSCGCKHSELSSVAVVKHGYSGERLYHVYGCMISRCYNPQNVSYSNYGGRGITVCNEWRNDYTKFRDWAIKNGYDFNAKRGDCTIDRINVNGNYEPSNCRWVDLIVQANNKRPSSEWKKRGKIYNYRGKEYRLSELAETFGVPTAKLYYRIITKGMSLEDALRKCRLTNEIPGKEVFTNA